jgi:uncharacterized phiE125 gp8 family phage protein
MILKGALTVGLKLISPPIFEPVTVEYAKDYLREYSDDLDGQIVGLISSVRLTAENFLNSAILTQTWEYSIDELPCGLFKLPMPPLQKVNSVKFYDSNNAETVIAEKDYKVYNSAFIAHMKIVNYPNTAPREVGALVINFTAGYTTAEQVPQDIKTAICEGVKALYDGKDLPPLFERLLWFRRCL